MFSALNWKLYGYGALFFLITVLFAGFRYRGYKVGKLEKSLDAKIKALKFEKKQSEFKAQNREAAGRAEDEIDDDYPDGKYSV